MVFSEPKVEFVRIDMKMATEGSNDCEDAAIQKTASGEDCINAGAPQNRCDEFNVFMF